MTGKPTFRKPLPEGAVEHLGLNAAAMVDFADGALRRIAGSPHHAPLGLDDLNPCNGG